MNKVQLSLALIINACLIVACDNSVNNSPRQITTPEEAPALLDPLAISATETAWRQGAELLQTCVDQSQHLRTTVRQLLAQPTDETLAASRQAWHRAHQQILSFSVFFAIAENNPGMFGNLLSYQFNLDAQPIQPGFVDYFDVYQFSGIVNDIAMTLSAETLRQQHGITDASDVSIGFHALEYLLWGENGQRPLEDFTAVDALSDEQSQQGLRIVDLSNNRRRVYLQLLAEMLVDDCTRLQQRWNDPTQTTAINYQALQAGSRLQLWRATSHDLINKIINQLTSSEPASSAIEAEASQSQDANSAGAEINDDNIVSDAQDNHSTHNLFAGMEAKVLAAQLGGLQILLYGSAVVGNQSPETNIAAWIEPNLGPEVDPSESAEDQALAPLISLQNDFNRAIADLNQQTQWPPENIEGIVSTLNQVQKILATDNPVAGLNQNAEEETPPSP